MAERAKFFDDIAGVAGGAFSAIAGIGEELGALIRTRVDEALAKLALVRREEFEVVSELASQARAGQEQAETRLAGLEARITTLEGSKAGPAGKTHDPHAADGAPGGPPSGIPGPGTSGTTSDMPPPVAPPTEF